MSDEGEVEGSPPNGSTERRILKVRLPQDQVIRLHELRILRGKSIAALLENILEDYLRRLEHRESAPTQMPGAPPGGHMGPPTADPPPVGPT